MQIIVNRKYYVYFHALILWSMDIFLAGQILISILLDLPMLILFVIFVYFLLMRVERRSGKPSCISFKQN